jgi:hypothetical protein
MKSIYISITRIFAGLLVLAFLSCTKDIDQTQNNGSSKCNNPSCYVPNQLVLQTFEVEANQWTKSTTGFESDFGPSLKAVAGEYHYVYNVRILNMGLGLELEPGKTVTFMNGALTMDGTRLFFNAYYNQLPFQSILLEVKVD